MNTLRRAHVLQKGTATNLIRISPWLHIARSDSGPQQLWHMSMTQPHLNNLPESDLELLSAYLDNQLSAAERVNLERRLGAEAQLRSELEELRATTTILRALEPVRPPRSFSLDPATAPRRRRLFPLASFLQLGSGLAGFALVLLASLQILSGPMPAAPTGASAASQAQSAGDVAANAPPAEAAREFSATAAPAAAAVEAPAAAAATTAPAAEAAAATAAPAADAPAAGAAQATGPADSVAPTAGKQDPDPAALPAPVANTGGAAESSPFEGAGGADLLQPTLPPIQASDSSSPDTAVLPANSSGTVGGNGVPAGLTLALGVALLGFGVGWYLYSRRRPRMRE